MKAVIEKSQLRNVIVDALSSSDTIFIQQPGNMGDALIAQGLFDFLGTQCFKIRTCKEYYPSHASVVFSGGGIMNHLYHDGQNMLRKFMSGSGQQFLLLPHTVHNIDEIIIELDDRFVFILRDQVSYEYVSDLNKKIKCFLHSDLAFYANYDRMRRRAFQFLGGEFLTALQVLIRSRDSIDLLRNLFSRKSRQNLAVFRGDLEAAGGATHWISELPSLDVSDLYASRYSSARELSVVAHMFVLICDKLDSVYTDRLHVAIACALLGRNVFLFDNIYGKNRAVYDFSLSGLSNVKFVN